MRCVYYPVIYTLEIVEWFCYVIRAVQFWDMIRVRELGFRRPSSQISATIVKAMGKLVRSETASVASYEGLFRSLPFVNLTVPIHRINVHTFNFQLSRSPGSRDTQHTGSL